MNSWNSAPSLRPTASAANSVFGTHILLDRAAEIPPEAPIWLWEGHLAVGKWHLIAGSPGTGKSGIALTLAASVSNGSPNSPRLPDGSIAPRGHVVILATEDGVADTIVPRLIAAGADMDYVHIVRGASDKGRTRQLGPEDYERLDAKLQQIPGVRLLILDPITQMVKKNANSNTEVRKALEPLTELAEKHGFAILGIAHLAKGSQKREPLERIAGSVAFSALCRIALLTVRGDADDVEEAGSGPAPCALVRIKSNIGPDGGGFSYTVRPAQFNVGLQQFRSSYIHWEGRLTGSAKAIIESIEGTGSGARSNALARAKAFLIEELEDGPQPAALVQQRAAEAKISMATLRRAREDLGVVVEKLRNGEQASPWMWSLPRRDKGDPVAGGGPLFPAGPNMSPNFNGGSQFPGGLFMPTPPIAFPAHSAMAGATGGSPQGLSAALTPGARHENDGHDEHLAHLGHRVYRGGEDNERHEQHQQHGQVGQVGQVQIVEPTCALPGHPLGSGWEEDEDEDIDDLEDQDPAIDQGLLSILISDCMSAHRQLPDMLKDNDDSLEGIEQAAVEKHVRPGDRFAYQRALNESDWMYL